MQKKVKQAYHQMWLTVNFSFNHEGSSRQSRLRGYLVILSIYYILFFLVIYLIFFFINDEILLLLLFNLNLEGKKGGKPQCYIFLKSKLEKIYIYLSFIPTRINHVSVYSKKTCFPVLMEMDSWSGSVGTPAVRWTESSLLLPMLLQFVRVSWYRYWWTFEYFWSLECR